MPAGVTPAAQPDTASTANARGDAYGGLRVPFVHRSVATHSQLLGGCESGPGAGGRGGEGESPQACQAVSQSQWQRQAQLNKGHHGGDSTE
jgi:hypothetical protein